MATPVVLVGFLVFGSHAEHFDWGFLPLLVSIPILLALLAFNVFDALYAAMSLVGKHPDQERMTQHRRVLGFDIVGGEVEEVADYGEIRSGSAGDGRPDLK